MVSLKTSLPDDLHDFDFIKKNTKIENTDQLSELLERFLFSDSLDLMADPQQPPLPPGVDNDPGPAYLPALGPEGIKRNTGAMISGDLSLSGRPQSPTQAGTSNQPRSSNTGLDKNDVVSDVDVPASSVSASVPPPRLSATRTSVAERVPTGVINVLSNPQMAMGGLPTQLRWQPPVFGPPGQSGLALVRVPPALAFRPAPGALQLVPRSASVTIPVVTRPGSTQVPPPSAPPRPRSDVFATPTPRVTHSAATPFSPTPAVTHPGLFNTGNGQRDTTFVRPSDQAIRDAHHSHRAHGRSRISSSAISFASNPAHFRTPSGSSHGLSQDITMSAAAPTLASGRSVTSNDTNPLLTPDNTGNQPSHLAPATSTKHSDPNLAAAHKPSIHTPGSRDQPEHEIIELSSSPPPVEEAFSIILGDRAANANDNGGGDVEMRDVVVIDDDNDDNDDNVDANADEAVAAEVGSTRKRPGGNPYVSAEAEAAYYASPDLPKRMVLFEWGKGITYVFHAGASDDRLQAAMSSGMEGGKVKYNPICSTMRRELYHDKRSEADIHKFILKLISLWKDLQKFYKRVGYNDIDSSAGNENKLLTEFAPIIEQMKREGAIAQGTNLNAWRAVVFHRTEWFTKIGYVLNNNPKFVTTTKNRSGIVSPRPTGSSHVSGSSRVTGPAHGTGLSLPRARGAESSRSVRGVESSRVSESSHVSGSARVNKGKARDTRPADNPPPNVPITGPAVPLAAPRSTAPSHSAAPTASGPGSRAGGASTVLVQRQVPRNTGSGAPSAGSGNAPANLPLQTTRHGPPGATAPSRTSFTPLENVDPGANEVVRAFRDTQDKFVIMKDEQLDVDTWAKVEKVHVMKTWSVGQEHEREQREALDVDKGALNQVSSLIQLQMQARSMNQQSVANVMNIAPRDSPLYAQAVESMQPYLTPVDFDIPAMLTSAREQLTIPALPAVPHFGFSAPPPPRVQLLANTPFVSGPGPFTTSAPRFGLSSSQSGRQPTAGPSNHANRWRDPHDVAAGQDASRFEEATQDELGGGVVERQGNASIVERQGNTSAEGMDEAMD
ncbi:hypothetical protein FS749_015035 [Ceratobasidium sp. UAMH 11750]|nr:hypothetical protein FS749_015035 [Ceratobasidium sp. UAMH 11750]